MMHNACVLTAGMLSHMNAEQSFLFKVVEGQVMISQGWVHDEEVPVGMRSVW